MKKRLLGINIPMTSKKDILDKIKKYTLQKKDLIHIISLNPENIVIAQNDRLFKKIIAKGQIKIIDGVGVILASKVLHLERGSRTTGVDLVGELIKWSSVGRLRVMLIGGKDNLAESLANCYSRSYPQAKFIGLKGIENIKKPKKSEIDNISSIIIDTKPHLLLVAFGSPYQEKWIWNNRRRLKGIVCMGVGGSFDYLSGAVSRPPVFLRKIGLEWFYRLITQPWRWKRQLRLIKFIWLVLKQKFNLNDAK
ncbi:MAG: WecB/TagA/CpsF family glycosyltransferase [bacterium]